MFQLKAYFDYWIHAKGRHGTHSPYVYDFLDKCVTSKIPNEVKNEYIIYRKKLLQDNTKITITDLGAGSRKMGSQRMISEIAKNAGSKGKYGRLLYQLSNYYNPSLILELGTSLGLGTFMLAKGNQDAKVVTVEACSTTLEVAKDRLAEHQLRNIEFINSSFQEFLADEKRVFDVVFIDGDHRGRSLVEQLNWLDSISHDETIFVLDDIRWSEDMYDTWKSIVKNEKYHLSMDLLRMGVIAKRKHQQKEHFIVKF